MNSIKLKPKKEIPVRNHHHWIFSGAVDARDNFEDGEILKVFSHNGEMLGHGYFNNQSIIQVRMLNFNEDDPMESLKENIDKAVEMRKKLFNEDPDAGPVTNCYRVVNGEGDEISGLIVDRYNDILVLQIATIGMDKLKSILIENVLNSFNKHFPNLKIVSIYEKSTMTARFKDGMEYFEGVVYGDEKFKTEVLENGIKFYIDFKTSQKTGLFLDMREMRKFVGEQTKGKNLLNCFSYTGGFSLYAARAGANRIDSVDIAADAIGNAEKNFDINGYDKSKAKFISTDAFEFLRHEDLSEYDFIILDPPAFAKKKQDLDKAKRGYGEINRTTMLKMKKGTFLLTCSCSYHLPREEFERIVKKAALDAGKNVKILQRHRLGYDHPLNIFQSEIDYLKSILLYVN